MLSKGPGINWRRPKNRVHFLDHGGSARRWGSAPSPSAAAPVRRLRGHGTRGELDVSTSEMRFCSLEIICFKSIMILVLVSYRFSVYLLF